MAPGTVIIIKVRNDVPSERALVQDDYMVETLPAMEPINRSTYGFATATGR
jgi:hypothetical protein